MSLRGAIVGFGHIAETTHLPALAGLGLEVVAVAEAQPARREAAERALPGKRVAMSLEQVLEYERLDFVDVCTPPHLHVPIARVALAAGAHVLCEKPLALRGEDADELARLAQTRERAVTCVHNWTQAPILMRARELQRGLGRLLEMDLVTLRTQPAAAAGDTGNWRIDKERAGGGILFDHGWHGMSILLRAFGAPPLLVRGRVEQKRHHGLSVEDSSETVLTFADGARGRFEATWAAEERKNTATMRCERGTIEIENDRLRLVRPGQPDQVERFEESLAGGGYRPAWTAGIVREFLAEIEQPAARGRSLAEARLCLRLIEATYASAAAGGNEIALGDAVRAQVG
jgi:predicted dehydrogenase